MTAKKSTRNRMTRMAETIAVAAIGAAASFTFTPPEALAGDLLPYARGSFADIRKAHAGRPLAVHFWSVTCAPCLAELADWAKIVREKKDIDVVFVSTDRPNDRARVENRLEKAGLKDAAHFGFADDFTERLYFEADHEWRGELPFTAFAGADGNLVTVIGAIDDPQIAAWLDAAGKTERR